MAKKNRTQRAAPPAATIAAALMSDALIGSRGHELKSWPEHFALAAAGLKPFEIRRNDRAFRAGDHLRVREWIPLGNGGGVYTGRELRQTILLVTEPIGVQLGFVALTVAPAEAPAT